MPEYLAPGVYVEETSFRAPSIEGVGTSTAAFVGPTLTGPVAGTKMGEVPELLTSFGDFASIYGGYDNLTLSTTATDPKNINYLALSVKGFFDNGGSRLYVSRVFTGGTKKDPNDGTKTVPDPGLATSGAASDDHVTLTARYPGSGLNGETLTVTLVAAKTQNIGKLPPGSLIAQLDDGGKDGKGNPLVKATLFGNGAGTSFATADGKTTLDPNKLPGSPLYVVTVAVAVPSASGGTSVFEGLGLDSNHPQFIGNVLGANPPRRIDALENQVAFVIGKNLKTAMDVFTDLFGTWTDPTWTDARTAATKTFTLNGGNDGAEPGNADYDTALNALDSLEDVAIVAAPGSSIYAAADAIVNTLILHVEKPRAYRVAVLDTPPNQIGSQVKDVRSKIDSSYAALYTPWVVTPNPLSRPGLSLPDEVTVPPSGFMAGIYARNDTQHSVAKAPANEVVLGALRFERNINFAEQGDLNPLGINCLRFFPGRGYRVWGARTASSNSEFKYINVRRYLVYLEHSIDNGTQWAVFENNGPLLWARVKESVEEFLYSELAGGNLLGTTPAEAYFVRCDRSTMTQNDLDNGRLICLIGVALLKPAEFVIFRIGQKTADARS
ncbi:MAG TPA: phage tail sheath subtilisin-like domain-containing protein [Candidatus Angelobacter sp.]|nr:phage tail sheath subtilisin-like domain-containing protein [Candidatus Angelobacter sp.]